MSEEQPRALAIRSIRESNPDVGRQLSQQASKFPLRSQLVTSMTDRLNNNAPSVASKITSRVSDWGTLEVNGTLGTVTATPEGLQAKVSYNWRTWRPDHIGVVDTKIEASMTADMWRPIAPIRRASTGPPSSNPWDPMTVTDIVNKQHARSVKNAQDKANRKLKSKITELESSAYDEMAKSTEEVLDNLYNKNDFAGKLDTAHHALQSKLSESYSSFVVATKAAVPEGIDKKGDPNTFYYYTSGTLTSDGPDQLTFKGTYEGTAFRGAGDDEDDEEVLELLPCSFNVSVSPKEVQEYKSYLASFHGAMDLDE
ncbi:hypothetical protein B9479_007882 [Cryptococcus floricola]|uniref:Uncharacterized protein n=1 Tax=Cryptococcus floricola TaxID=2591691 RepID=A0A5D3AKQ2_9TREE|nr:hypothetical protein B9479_007882 [Cryptococcus floricola]